MKRPPLLPWQYLREKAASLLELSNILTARLISRQSISNLNIELEVEYKCCNPSLFLYNGEIRGIIRTVNYTKENHANSTRFISGSQWDTINYYVAVSKSSKYKIVTRIEDQKLRLKGIGDNGLEDLRVFSHNSNYYVIGSLACQGAPASSTMFTAEFDPDRGTIQNMKVIPSPNGMNREKNWMPFQHDDDLYIVYNFHPLVIYRLHRNPEGFSLGEKLTLPTPERHEKRYSGGTNLIAYGKGLLGIIHRRIVLMGTSYYKHAFIYLESGMGSYQISQEFFFRSRGIEFALSLFSMDGNLYVGSGELDRRAWMDSYDPGILAELGLKL